MIKSAEKYQISKVFDTDNPILYKIPKYQREYTWGKDHWDDLYNDIYENDRGHFIGSIICVNISDDSYKPELEIIDGQQRLTTISLIFASIYEKLKEDKKADETYITELNNLKNRIIHKRKANSPWLELQTQNFNNDDYKTILGEVGLVKNQKKVKNFGNRQIKRAYRFFYEKINQLAYNDILDFIDKINSTLVVKIEVESHSDAYLLFESLNNRGEPLSAIDIIKNNLLSNLEKKKIMNIDDSFEQWKEIIDFLPEPEIQQRFLRQYYNAYIYKEEVKVEKITRATRSNLIRIYENLIKRDPKKVFDELYNKSRIYSTLVRPEDNNEYHEGLKDLLHIGAAPLYTFLLYLFSEHGNKKEMLVQIISFFVKYFVRRNLTDFPATRDLDQIFMDLINKCENKKDKLDYDLIYSYMTVSEYLSNIKELQKRLSNDIYIENTGAARFVLCKIEEIKRTKERHTELWAKEKDKYVWTIEHIFPEGKKIPVDWIDMIANGDKSRAEEYQEKWVHKLGNLTMSGYNPSLFNSSFLTKRDKNDKKGNYIGYKNGLFLNEDLASKSNWTIEDIQIRTAKLINEALNIFKVEGEEVLNEESK